MAEYSFERECRTPFSESYAVESESGDDIARVDLGEGSQSPCLAALFVALAPLLTVMVLGLDARGVRGILRASRPGRVSGAE